AFGWGLERIAVLRHGIPDLRELWRNDPRLLTQFYAVRVPLSWLREYVDVAVPAADLARRLSISSLEVELVVETGVTDTNGNLGLFPVAKVVEAGKPPNADRLQLCRVDVGESEPRQIV